MHRFSHVNSISTRPLIHRIAVLTIVAVVVVLTVLLLYQTAIAGPGDKEVTITTAEDLQIGGCDDNDDTTACSLRDAIVAANANKRIQTINIPDISGTGITTFTLTIQGSDEDAAKQGDLDIKKDLEIVGQGAGKTIIVGMGDRVFEVLPNVGLAISDMTITGGSSNSVGGAIRGRGDLQIANAVIIGNEASGDGGAIWSEDPLSVTRSAIVNNSAGGNGGAIHVESGSATVSNSTISGNSATASGGGIHVAQSSSLNLSFVTLTDNGAGQGGGLNNAGNASYDSTIFAGNSPDACNNVSGTTTSGGYNLFGATSSCSTGGTDDTTASDALLAPLSLVPVEPVEDGIGETYVHELLAGSPAADKIPSDGTNGCGTTVVTDQRGEVRPLGTKCEIGAYEAILAQPGPIFENNTIDVTYDGVCGFEHCNLREAIEAANNKENEGGEPDEIHFNIPGSNPDAEHVIHVTAALPAITDPVIISGTTQMTGTVVLQGPGGPDEGACDASSFDGLTITGGGSVVSGLEIQDFPGDGVSISTNGGNMIADNDVHDNGGAGVCVDTATGNPIRGNTIWDNTAAGISLINDGNLNQQPPTVTVSIVRTADYTPTSDIGGYINGVADTTYEIEVFSNPSCDNAQGQYFLGSTSLTTGGSGQGTFLVQGLDPLAVGAGATATATDPNGNTSEFSVCKTVETLNDSWLTAKPLSDVVPVGGASSSQVIFQNGQAAWFKFPVEKDGKLTLTVNGQTDTVMTLHSNLFEQYEALEEADDAAALAASDLPAGFLPAGFLPAGFLPAGFLPAGFLPAGFLPAGFLPAGFLPAGFLPAGFLPAGFLPAGFLPEDYLPGESLPAGFLPAGFLPAGFLPELYSGSVRRSLVAITYDPAASEQTIVRNTWDNSGDMYVFVNSPASLSEETTVTVTYEGGLCDGVGFLDLPQDLGEIVNGNFPPDLAGKNTLIVWDSDRMLDEDPSGDMVALRQKLDEFAAHSTVNGVVIDLAENGGNMFPRVTQANTNADNNPSCVSAKNEVATEIKRVVNAYRAEAGPSVEYVTLVGSDHVIPYFRYPDEAGLANENEYVVPVGPTTPSEAALRRGQVLGQDGYGATNELTRSGYSVPLPDAAVGRLLRTAGQVSAVIDAYIATDGVVTPGSALATGYDFVADIGERARDEFSAGLAGTVDELITPQEDGLEGAWTAEQLRAELFDKRHDLVFMAGHFAAGSLVAADYQTQLSASEVATGDFANSVILGLGCHGGYNVPEPDSIIESPDPDWAEIFLAEQATLVASTGYAYGDSDVIGYGELLFLNLIQQLRSNDVQEVAIGKALVEAKLDYFIQHPVMEGIDDKTVLETTLFGPPMLKVDMPGERIAADEASVVSSVAPLSSDVEGATGLYVGQGGPIQLANTVAQTSTIQVTTVLTPHHRLLTDTVTGESRTVTYFEGEDGVTLRAAEPIFPLVTRIVDVPGFILRDVGFDGGHYTDEEDITPWTSAPSTENSRARPAFYSDIKYPTDIASVNYADTVSGGAARLMITPAQYQSESCSSVSGTMRLFDSLDVRLYFLPEDWAQLPVSDTVRLAAVAAAPEIIGVTSMVDSNQINVSVEVRSDPGAPVAEVWSTWTDPEATGADGTNTWQSFNLQDTGDGVHWEASLSTADVPTSALFMIQAAGAGGLVSQDTNDGAFHEFGTPPPVAQRPTTLSFTELATNGAFGEKVTFKAKLSEGAVAVGGQQIILALGGQRVCAETNSAGVATFSLALSQSPGAYTVQASFRGDSAAGLAPTVTGQEPFEILRDDPQLTLESLVDNFTILSGEPNDVAAVLKDSEGRPLPEKTISFVASDGVTETPLPVELKTNLDGRVALGVVDTLASGEYELTAHFSGYVEGETEGLFDDVLLYLAKSATVSLTVNSRPVADAAGPYQVDEGSSINLDGSNSADEGSLVSYDWDFDYDGSAFDVDASGSTPTFDASSLDGPLTRTIALKVTDNIGATDVDTTTLVVGNVAPVVGPVEAVNDPAITFGITATAVFSDAGIADTHAALWDWGDGTSSSGTVTEAGGSGTVIDSHTYSAAGFYTITLTVTDDDGAQDQTILPNFMVFEAGVGKVTGGGKVDAPAATCVFGQPYCNPNKASEELNFGFDVQYTGGDVPAGQTTITYKGGGLVFQSVEQYDALVVIDDVAFFNGQGTLSGSGLADKNAFFEVWTIDSDINNSGADDRFGVKIWYVDGGRDVVVVDTSENNGDPFGTLPGIKGSSVKIH